MSFPLYIAKRYLFARRGPRFASFLTLVAMLGIAVGVGATIVVMSVMTGFSRDLESKLMGFNPHVTVTYEGSFPTRLTEQLRANFSEIDEIVSFVTGEVVVEVPGNDAFSSQGAKVLGFSKIPVGLERSADFFWADDRNARWWYRFISPVRSGLVLGIEMMYGLGVHPDFEDQVHLIAPFGGIDPLGNPRPTKREYKLIGSFKSGFFEYDMKYILMDYAQAGRLLGAQKREGIRIMIDDVANVPGFVTRVKKFLGPSYNVSGWTERNRKLFAALKLERLAMNFLLSLIIIIASFSVVGVVLMMVFSKRRDLAILAAIGASKRGLKSLFLFHGGLIGLVGALVGAAIGGAVCLVLKESDIALPPSYYLDYLPVSVDLGLILSVLIGGIAISVIAAWYPARRAAGTDPVRLLRYE